MKIRFNSFVASSMWMIICLLEILVLKNMTFSEYSLRIITIIAIVNCILQIITIRITGNRLFSFFTAFIIFLYLFHFGEAITGSFYSDINFDFPNYILHYMTDKTIAWETLICSLAFICVTFSGGILFYTSCANTPKFVDKEEIDDEQVLEYRICKYMGYLLFAISTPLKLYFDIKQLLAAASGGYYAARNVESFSGVFSCIANFWYVSIPLIYLTIKSKKIRKIFVSLLIGYICLTMLTGNRGRQVVNLIAIFLVIHHSSEKKLNVGKIIKWCFIVFIALVFLNLVFDIRKYNLSYFLANFGQFVEEALEKNVLVETCHNFGSSIFTPYLVIEGYGTDYTPFFGETYLKSFVSVVPDFLHAFKDINNQAIFSRVLNTKHLIGGSFIAEAYYNFGKLCYAFAFLFGVIYLKISNALYIAVKRRNLGKVCILYPFLAYSLWWVRDTVGGVTRPIVWLLIIYILISHAPEVRRKK